MDTLSLTGAQRAYLRGLGQRLEPAIKLGREGVSPALLAELDRLLRTHELVKVRFVNADRTERATLCDTLSAELHSPCIGAVGHTAVFYRQNPDVTQRQVNLP